MIKFVNASFEVKDYCYYSRLKSAVLILFFLIVLNGNSQQLYFKNFTAIDGLSSSEVYDITQDSKGYLWFATDRGLTRYDGKKFTRYTTSDGLPDNVVFNFYEQKDGTIWCTTQNRKVFYFKNFKDGFHHYSYNETILENIPKKAIISNLAISNNNELLLGLQEFDGFLGINHNGRIIHKPYKFSYRQNKYSVYKSLKFAPDFIFKDNKNLHKEIDTKLIWDVNSLRNNSDYTRMLHFPNHNLKIASLGNAFSIINSSDSISNKVKYNQKEQAIAIMSGKYNENMFWVGYQYGGVVLSDVKGNFKNHFLKNESVTKLYKDHEGGLWIATLNAGVFYCKEPQILYKSFESYPVNLTKNENDELFLAFHNGEVLQKKENNYSLLYKSDKSFPAYVKYDKEHKYLYYGDYTKKWFLDSKRKLRKCIYGVSDDIDNTTGYTKNSIEVKEDNQFKVVNIPERIFDVSVKDSTFLIGTLGGLYSYENKKLEHQKNKSSFYSSRVSDIDHKFENIYVSTMGSGLIIEKKDTIFSINKKSGLLSDICTEVFVEDPYTIWLGTNRGLNRITLYKNNTYDIEKLSIKEGLLCSEILDIEIIDENVFVASKEGLFQFPKSIIGKEQERQQRKWLEIDRVTLGGELLKFKDFIVVEYPNPDIKIAFKSISFKDGEGARYRYKINENSEWNYTMNSSIDLPDLPYGNYLFKLQVQTEDGFWKESIQKSITILPPFWKTWWFNLLVFGVVSLLVFLSFKYKVLTFNKKHIKLIYFGILNKLRAKEEDLFVNIKSDGKIIKLVSNEIGYFKSSRNYVEIHTAHKKYLIRKKLDDFYNDLPDLVEFTKVHRSYYVRLDKVAEIKGNKELSVFNTSIPVSKTYVDNLKRISA